MNSKIALSMKTIIFSVSKKNPAGPFAISKPQDQEIGALYAIQKRRAKSCKGSVGKWAKSGRGSLEVYIPTDFSAVLEAIRATFFFIYAYILADPIL